LLIPLARRCKVDEQHPLLYRILSSGSFTGKSQRINLPRAMIGHHIFVWEKRLHPPEFKTIAIIRHAVAFRAAILA
jgi:hypothetical protein